MPHARREKTEVSSKNVCACGEASGIRRDTERRFIKKKLMQNKFLDEAAPANAGQQLSVKAMAKFIVISFQEREQVVAFPFEIQHAAMLNKIQRQHGNVQAISAGFFLGDSQTLYVGGESTTLELPSRTQDVELVRAFLTSPTPEFNFIAGGAQ
jgi:hypothetical protein